MKRFLRHTFFLTALLASVVLACAGVSYDESPAFTFDTCDYLGGLAAESAKFAFDRRVPSGLSSSAVSFAFSFDTRSVGLVGLTISGEEYVNVGPEYAYTVMAHFSDGSQSDVTTEVKWSTRGWPRNVIRPDGTLTIGFDDPTDQPLIIRAQYMRPDRALTAEFQIMRGISPEIHVFLYNPRVGFLRPGSPGYVWSLNAGVQNVLNAQGAVSYVWTLNGQPLNGATSAILNTEFTGQAGTAMLQVRATDAQGHTAVDTRKVVFNQPGLNEPGEKYPANDPEQGVFVDSRGQPFAFDANRIQNGLIVLTHGLRGTENDVWLRNLGNAIEARLSAEGKPLPNIAIFGWKEGANPTVHYGEGLDDEGFVARLLQVDRFVLHSYNYLFLGFGVGDFMFDIGVIRPEGLHYGEVLADWVTSEIAAGHINGSAPIHFIGHSAGGFVVGEAGKLLKPTVDVTQVTMLDTPLPVLSHFKGTPQPPPAERYVSSYFGAIAPLVDVSVFESANYHRRNLASLHLLAGTLVPTPAAHGYSHDWYWSTVGDQADSERDGFYYSPFFGNHWLPPSGGANFRNAKNFSSEESLTDFATFGNVQTNGAQYVIGEAGNSGLIKDMTLPVGATALKFQYQFTTPGDGDFLAVYFGENPPLYIGSDLPLTRSAPLAVEIPLLGYAGQTGALVIKLVSRGVSNAVLVVNQIALTIDDDPDGDGLTSAEEASLGTDPLLRDTDGDGWDDAYEVNVSHTSPLIADTDSDGVFDPIEQLAGTNPTNSASVFAMKEVARNDDGSVTLRWNSQTGKTYRVLRSLSVDFTNFDVIVSGISAMFPINSYTDTYIPNTNTPTIFYRIAVE